ncbi:hypothetical protein [Actinomyces oris]|uniref:hypothetical protein n=1 Tax=Actinomyces oris TaxID=544580 RepID=UPI000B1BD7EE|nr:hypothetical protein [Actinomyces oris]
MAKGRGRNHGESAGRRGSARRGAGSSSGRSSSGSQSRPHRQGGSGGGPRSGAGQSSSSRSGGTPRSSQARGRGGRASGTKSTGRPLHSGQTGRPAGGQSGTPVRGGKNRRSPQGSQGTSTPRSRQAAPGTARSSRTSSTQAARSDRRRHSWGAGLQWTHIGGGRLTGAPDSIPQGPDQPRSGRLRKPVPPQPRYGLRRALVLGGVLLVLLLLILTIAVGYFWVRNTIRTQDEERAAAQVHTVYPTPGKCDPSTLKSTVQGPESVSVGAGATFSISLVNSGQAPCLIDVGSQALGVRVSSGSQQVWDSVTCPVGQTEKALLLPAGKGADVNVTWNGNAATSDCAAANAAPASPASPAGASASSTPSATASSSASPSAGQAQTAPGSAAGAGTYRFRFVMGDKDLTEDRVFVVG